MRFFRLVVTAALGDFREESFLLVLANFLWVVCTVPGALVLGAGLAGSQAMVVLAGVVLLLPWPIATFGLFALAYKTARRLPVGLKSFFDDMRLGWRQALWWGGVNVLVLVIGLLCLKFYLNPVSPLGRTVFGPVLGAVFAVLLLLWGMWQLAVLPLYPRYPAAGLGAILKRAGALALARPGAVLVVALLSLFIAVVGIWLVPLGLLFSASLIALLVNRVVVYLLNEKPERNEDKPFRLKTG